MARPGGRVPESSERVYGVVPPAIVGVKAVEPPTLAVVRVPEIARTAGAPVSVAVNGNTHPSAPVAVPTSD